MAITVKTVRFDGRLEVVPYKKENGVYVHTTPCRLYGRLERNGVTFDYEFSVKPGYTGNFASSPKLKVVQFLVPSYVAEDPIYNEGFDLHDWLYSREGKCTSGQDLTRSEVDDLARGIMRSSPTLAKNKSWFARFRCSVMDLSVGLFAGNKRHWGNDSYNSKSFATFDLRAVNGDLDV